MKLSNFLGAALIGCAASSALGACTGTVLNLTDLTTLLTGNTVCGRPGASYPGDAADRWQEEHVSGGTLFDYKRGPGHPVDPRTQVGTWLVSATTIRSQPAAVKHTYSPTTVFNWIVFGPTTNVPGTSVYSFCTAGAAPVEHVRAFVIGSGAGCGGTYPP